MLRTRRRTARFAHTHDECGAAAHRRGVGRVRCGIAAGAERGGGANPQGCGGGPRLEQPARLGCVTTFPRRTCRGNVVTRPRRSVYVFLWRGGKDDDDGGGVFDQQRCLRTQTPPVCSVSGASPTETTSQHTHTHGPPFFPATRTQPSLLAPTRRPLTQSTPLAPTAVFSTRSGRTRHEERTLCAEHTWLLTHWAKTKNVSTELIKIKWKDVEKGSDLRYPSI